MGRVTQAQQIELRNEAVALDFFKRGLALLSDPRRRLGIRYPLVSDVTVALMAMVCGCDDADAMEVWSEANGDWLNSLLELPHGVPTQDVFLTVFGALDLEAFSAAFGRGLICCEHTPGMRDDISPLTARLGTMLFT
jgi:hypothetical protein